MMSSNFQIPHRGVSEVTGGIIMLGVVGMIAAGVLTLGLSSISDFQTFLLDVSVTDQSLKESIIVEHVNFDEGTTTVNLFVRNIGLNDVTIESIAITDINTQELLLLQNNVNYKIQPRSMLQITPTAASCTFTDDTDCTNTTYRITLVTTRGNIYESEAIPFNT